MHCRICSHPIKPFMTFGKMPIANGFLNKQEFANEYFFELAPAFCENCKMFQIVEQPDPTLMFHDHYAFFSSTSQRMAHHFEDMAQHYIEEFLSTPQENFVVELGSNDGIMLRHFAAQNIKHLGIEPSANVDETARQKGVNSLCAFFNEATAQKVVEEYGQADIISAANVMCHIPDLHSVGRGVSLLLKPKGIFVFEDPYLGDMFQKTSYDQIYDEHVFIFSTQSIMRAFREHGLEVFDVAPQSTHGGSMRYYLCRKGTYKTQPSVPAQLSIEATLGLDKRESYDHFREKCEQSRHQLTTLLRDFKSQDKRIVGYAATSKSTTVLNYCGIGPDLIEFISDTTPLKQGKYSPGMHIPIKPYEKFKENYPDYALLFAWNHAQEIYAKEQEFTAHGGQWITFVPEVKIL